MFMLGYNVIDMSSGDRNEIAALFRRAICFRAMSAKALSNASNLITGRVVASVFDCTLT